MKHNKFLHSGHSFKHQKPDKLYRPASVFVHCIGCNQKQDKLIFKEDDDSFFLDVKLSKDCTHVFISSNSKDTSEIHAIDLRVTSPLTPKIVLIQERVNGVRYFIDHAADQYYLATNCDRAHNFKLMTAKDREVRETKLISRPFSNSLIWKEIIPHNPLMSIEDVDVLKVIGFILFSDHFAEFEQLNFNAKCLNRIISCVM